jgi:hypothetical protein
VCNLKRKTEYEKYKILCSFFFHEFIFIERTGGKSRKNGVVKEIAHDCVSSTWVLVY